MSRSRARLGVLGAVCASALAGTAEAAVFSDSMESYADSAAVQAAWLPAYASASNPGLNATIAYKTPSTLLGPPAMTPTPASGKVLGENNGVRYRDLGATVTENWTLEAKMLHSNYGRGGAIFLLDATGHQGYGLLWDSGGPGATSGGTSPVLGGGHLAIRKFDVPAYSSWNTSGTAFGIGAILGTQTYTRHPVTGYAVTGGTDDTTATFDTSTWQDMMDVKLTWEKDAGPTGKNLLTLYSDGQKIGDSVEDDTFSSFGRVYLRGNTTVYFDDVSVSVPEPTMLAPLAIGGAMTLARRRKEARA